MGLLSSTNLRWRRQSRCWRSFWDHLLANVWNGRIGFNMLRSQRHFGFVQCEQCYFFDLQMCLATNLKADVPAYGMDIWIPQPNVSSINGRIWRVSENDATRKYMQILCAGFSESGWNCGQWEKNNSVNLPSWTYHVVSCHQSKEGTEPTNPKKLFQQKELFLYAVRWWWYRSNLLKVGQNCGHVWSLVAWFVFLQLNWVTWMRTFQFEPFRVFCKLGSKDSVFWSLGTAKIFVKVSKAVACGWIPEWLQG